MAYCWKTEYHAIAKGGDTLAYLDTLEEAKVVRGCHRVERVKYYLDERDTVWESNDDALGGDQ